jgi:hypothetical protein
MDNLRQLRTVSSNVNPICAGLKKGNQKMSCKAKEKRPHSSVNGPKKNNPVSSYINAMMKTIQADTTGFKSKYFLELFLRTINLCTSAQLNRGAIKIPITPKTVWGKKPLNT